MTPSILQRIAGGDSSAVRACIDQYGALVWSLACRLSRTPSDAEDATQEIFLQIWQQAARFDDSLGSEKTFVATIARRRLIDRLRKTSAEPLTDSSDEVFESLACSKPGTPAETYSDAEQAMQALAQLRPEYRQVLELGILRDFSHAEIAKRLRLPLGTVKSFMRRGLMRVREFMNVEITPAAAREDFLGFGDTFPVDFDCLDRPTVAVSERFGVTLGPYGIAHFESQLNHPRGLSMDEIACV